jgi:hypothetical protein
MNLGDAIRSEDPLRGNRRLAGMDLAGTCTFMSTRDVGDQTSAADAIPHRQSLAGICRDSDGKEENSTIHDADTPASSNGATRHRVSFVSVNECPLG